MLKKRISAGLATLLLIAFSIPINAEPYEAQPSEDMFTTSMLLAEPARTPYEQFKTAKYRSCCHLHKPVPLS